MMRVVADPMALKNQSAGTHRGSVRRVSSWKAREVWLT